MLDSYLDHRPSDIPIDIEIRLLETRASEVEIYIGCGHEQELIAAYRRDLEQGSLDRKVYIGIERDDEIVKSGIQNLIREHSEKTPYRERILLLNYDILELHPTDSIYRLLKQLSSEGKVKKVGIYFPEEGLLNSLFDGGKIYTVLSDILSSGGEVVILTEYGEMTKSIEQYLKSHLFTNLRVEKNMDITYLRKNIGSEIVEELERQLQSGDDEEIKDASYFIGLLRLIRFRKK
jgi:hypothetical protein